MKQTFIHILLGFFIATTIAAGTMAVTTVKPATPQAVIVKSFNESDDAVMYTRKCVAQGWIVKCITTNANSGNGWAPTLIVLEKY